MQTALHYLATAAADEFVARSATPSPLSNSQAKKDKKGKKGKRGDDSDEDEPARMHCCMSLRAVVTRDEVAVSSSEAGSGGGGF